MGLWGAVRGLVSLIVSLANYALSLGVHIGVLAALAFAARYSSTIAKAAVQHKKQGGRRRADVNRLGLFAKCVVSLSRACVFSELWKESECIGVIGLEWAAPVPPPLQGPSGSGGGEDVGGEMLSLHNIEREILWSGPKVLREPLPLCLGA